MLHPDLRSQEERNTLVLEYLNLPSAVWKKYRRHPYLAKVPRDDLIQAGYLVLIRCAETWREDGGSRFLTFAWQRVLGAMLDYTYKWLGKRRHVASLPVFVTLDETLLHGISDAYLCEIHDEIEYLFQCLSPEEESLLRRKYLQGTRKCKKQSTRELQALNKLREVLCE